MANLFERIKTLLGAAGGDVEAPAVRTKETAKEKAPRPEVTADPVPNANGDLEFKRLKGPLTSPTLEVAGRLKISQCTQLKELPNEIMVGGDLLIENCPRLEALPPGLKVGRNLVVRGCPGLQQIPRTIEVGGDLKLFGRTRLDAFPADLSVTGDVIIQYSVRSLEAGKVSRGNLALLDCKALTELPAGLEVGGDLIIRRTPITALPARMVVGGGLELRFSLVQGLPADLQLGDYLDLEGCAHLESLPPDLTVPSWLRLDRCVRLRGLSRMVVGSGRRTRRSPWSHNELDQANRRPKMINGNLSLQGCRALSTIQEGLKVRGSIEIGGTKLKEMPESCTDNRLLWHGVLVPPQVAFEPETITDRHILGCDNQELRRVMLERLGLGRFKELAAQNGTLEVLQEDTDSGGARRLLRLRLEASAEPTVCLECRCPSTGRIYLLRVPPSTRSCQAAAAWIAGFDDPMLYQPVIET
jgi:hypothetical protein